MPLAQMSCDSQKRLDEASFSKKSSFTSRLLLILPTGQVGEDADLHLLADIGLESDKPIRT